MRILLLALLLGLASVAASASGPRGSRHHLPPGTLSARYVLRAAPAGGSSCEWRLDWQSLGDGYGRYAKVTSAGKAGDDDLSGALLDFEYGSRSGAEDIPVRNEKIRIKDDIRRHGLTLVLEYAPGGASLEVGSRRAVFSLPVDLSFADTVELRSYVSAADTLLRDDLHLTPGASRGFIPVDTLAARLAASGDPRETRWQYFDRNTDPLLARPGGKYTLATLSDGQGGYEIVYISGAGDARADWTSGRLKGHMRRTPVTGVYDLTWYTADGQCIDTDASATMDVIGEVPALILEFPAYKATFRFVKAKD